MKTDERAMDPNVSGAIIGNLLRAVCNRPSQITGFAERYKSPIFTEYPTDDDFEALARFINQTVCNSILASMEGKKYTVEQFVNCLQELLNEESIRTFMDDPQNARTLSNIPISMN